MSTILLDSTVGDLVVESPSRSRVLERFGIDYCCGGKRSLADACARRHVDPLTVLKALQQADLDAGDEADEDVAALPLDALADHIEATHHAYLKTELPRLDGMIRKVALVHGKAHPWMTEVLEVYRALAHEMLTHLEKEESVLFPLIREGSALQDDARSQFLQNLAAPIRVMEHEHDDAGRALARLRELTHDYTPPEGACNTFRAVLDGLRELEADMHRHVHKENNLLFPRALHSA